MKHHKLIVFIAWIITFNQSLYNINLFHHLYAYTLYKIMCSGSVVVTAYDSESGHPGSTPEWGLIYYEASITA